MKAKTLSEHLLNHLKENEGAWIKKVSLFVIADECGYSPESAGRELRYLVADNKISVGYYDGTYAKNLAKYSYNPPVEKVRKVRIEDGVAHEYYV